MIPMTKEFLPPSISAEDWDATPPPVQAFVLSLQETIKQLQAQTAELASLKTRLYDLEARLKQNSQNSSRPPSSDPPSAPPKPPRTPRGKPRSHGAQPGHEGQNRDLVPPEQVNEFVSHHPTVCPHCETSLAPDLPDTAPIQRHQVWDIPPIEPIITEHQMHAVCCPSCQKNVRAVLPDEFRAGYGSHATAITSLLHGRYRLSVDETSEVLDDLFHLPMSAGSVVKNCERVSEALQPVYDEVLAILPTQTVVNVDETGWKQQTDTYWLWTVVTPFATLFHLNRSRGGAVWRALLGATFTGILGSDRLPAYNTHPVERRQLCWAHLKRNIQAIAERGDASAKWGSETLKWVQKLFALWHAYQERAISRATWEVALEYVKDGIWEQFEQGNQMEMPKAQSLSRELMRLWDGLWVFALVEGVEPTNNAAEQALRPAVLWRKGSFGTRSEAGSRFVERILTVRETCRRQGKPLLQFVTDAVEACRRGGPVPSILAATT